jgi:hypothetical protein
LGEQKKVMGKACLFGHKWVGCRCERCGETRDQGHDWAGCRCERCGLVRDDHHDWELVHCRQKCRKCGRQGSVTHDWQGCVCARCGATNHAWVDGVCLRCHERCHHSEFGIEWQGKGDQFTVRGKLSQVCKRCGMPIKGLPLK